MQMLFFWLMWASGMSLPVLAHFQWLPRGRQPHPCIRHQASLCNHFLRKFMSYHLKDARILLICTPLYSFLAKEKCPDVRMHPLRKEGHSRYRYCGSVNHCMVDNLLCPVYTKLWIIQFWAYPHIYLQN